MFLWALYINLKMVDVSTAKYARVLDTRLKASEENKVCFVVEEGANVVNYTPLVSSSNSTSNTSFNLNNIADVTCRDPRLCIEMTVTATVTLANSTGAAVIPVGADNFGFKQWPINRCVSSVQHQINQASYTLNSNDIIDSIARINSIPMDVDFYDNTQPDFIDSYANATGATFNPLAQYTSTIAGDGVYKPRVLNYTLTGNSIAANATSNLVITATFYEPLITPFTNISSKDHQGLYAITGELINIQWVGDIFNNMFAFAVPAGLAIVNPQSVPVSFGTNACSFCISAVL